jgi:hypothetical protein
MPYEREKLPDPVSYYEYQGLNLRGSLKAPWRTTECRFHGGSDSMRIKVANGAFRCMACEARGGDVIAYHMAAYCLDFVQASKELGAWVDDGEAQPRQYRPTPLSPRDALQIIEREATLIATAAGNIAQGIVLLDADRLRVMAAAGRIGHVVRGFE